MLANKRTNNPMPLVCLFFVLLLYGAARADITQGSLAVNGMALDRPKGFMEFGFQQNGTVSLFLTALPTDVPLYLLICAEIDQSKFAYSIDEMCMELQNWEQTNNDGDKICQVTQVFRDYIRLYYVIPRYGYYYFNLVNCHQKNAIVDVHATLLNPGNNHLTATLVPVPIMYGLMAALWGVVIFGWGAHMLRWWRATVGLHFLLLAFPVLKCFFDWYALEYYSYYAVHGVLYPRHWLLHYGSYIIFQVLFHLLLLVLSRGWGTTRPYLKSDKYYIFAILTAMFIVMMFRYLYSTHSQILALMVALGLIGFRVIILVYVFMGVNSTIRHLESAMLGYSGDVQDTNAHIAFIKRHRISVRLKVIILTWIGLNTGAFFTNLILFEGETSNWVDLMNTEFLDFILYIMLACNFRLRPIPNLYISKPALPSTSPSSPQDESRLLSSSHSSSSDESSTGGIEMVALGSRNNLYGSDNGDNSSLDTSRLTSAIIPMSDDVVMSDTDGDEDEEALINKRR